MKGKCHAKIMKRGFCLFLVAVLLAGLVPCAFADEAMPTGEVEASEAATEAAEETTAPPETAVPSESTEPPEATETTELETEVTEPEADPVEDAPEDAVEDDRLATYASTVTNVLLFDKARTTLRNTCQICPYVISVPTRMTAQPESSFPPILRC